MVGDESPSDFLSGNDLAGNETPQKIEDFQCTANASVSAIEEAAKWLALNRSAVVGPIIPFLKSKFGLTNIEAIEATKAAHMLRHGREVR